MTFKLTAAQIERVEQAKRDRLEAAQSRRNDRSDAFVERCTSEVSSKGEEKEPSSLGVLAQSMQRLTSQ